MISSITFQKIGLCEIAFFLLIAQAHCQMPSKEKINHNPNAMLQQFEIPKETIPEKYSGADYLFLVYSPGDRYVSPNGSILYPDGTILRYSDKIISVDSAGFTFSDAALEWRKTANINADGLEKIQKLLNDFKPDNLKEISQHAIIIEYFQAGKIQKTYAEGENTPNNYQFFTAINSLISAHTIPVE